MCSSHNWSRTSCGCQARRPTDSSFAALRKSGSASERRARRLLGTGSATLAARDQPPPRRMSLRFRAAVSRGLIARFRASASGRSGSVERRSRAPAARPTHDLDPVTSKPAVSVSLGRYLARDAESHSARHARSILAKGNACLPGCCRRCAARPDPLIAGPRCGGPTGIAARVSPSLGSATNSQPGLVDGIGPCSSPRGHS
jgi:hypothetical protein